jgi:hypothetical protein
MKGKLTARLTLQVATESFKLGKTKTNRKQPTCEPNLCCKLGRNGKIQPSYWLATDHNTRTRQKTDQQK